MRNSGVGTEQKGNSEMQGSKCREVKEEIVGKRSLFVISE
jgi:hypothetical protein